MAGRRIAPAPEIGQRCAAFRPGPFGIGQQGDDTLLADAGFYDIFDAVYGIFPIPNEVDLRYADVLTAADNLAAFRAAINAIAAQSGHLLCDQPYSGQSGSGPHVNLSLQESGAGLFSSPIHGEKRG